MSRQISLYCGYQVCTDGSLKPAEVLVTNYLVRTYGETARKIFEKHGMREIVDYRRYDGDYDAFIIIVRPGTYNKIREMLIELSDTSKKIQVQDHMEEVKWDQIRSDAMLEFERVFREIDNLLGEDVG